jgi:hypothetical protein
MDLSPTSASRGFKRQNRGPTKKFLKKREEKKMIKRLEARVNELMDTVEKMVESELNNPFLALVTLRENVNILKGIKPDSPVISDGERFLRDHQKFL